MSDMPKPLASELLRSDHTLSYSSWRSRVVLGHKTPAVRLKRRLQCGRPRESDINGNGSCAGVCWGKDGGKREENWCCIPRFSIRPGTPGTLRDRTILWAGLQR
jgi:hypothetical protein